MAAESLIPIEPFLPHRKPMLMVDAIVEISDERVLCKFNVSEECIFVKHNILQEVGLLENMAQTCSSITGQTYFEDLYDPNGKGAIGFISAIKNFTFTALPSTDSVIYTEAILENKFQGDDYTLSTMLVKVSFEDQIIAEGTINLFLQEERK